MYKYLLLKNRKFRNFNLKGFNLVQGVETIIEKDIEIPISMKDLIIKTKLDSKKRN